GRGGPAEVDGDVTSLELLDEQLQDHDDARVDAAPPYREAVVVRAELLGDGLAWGEEGDERVARPRAAVELAGPAETDVGGAVGVGGGGGEEGADALARPLAAVELAGPAETDVEGAVGLAEGEEHLHGQIAASL